MPAAPNPWLARRIIGFAHQGGALEAPPGTLQAMRTALAHGAAALEFDLHLARDKSLVIHHDRVVASGDRSLTIADHTLDELRAVLPDLAILDQVVAAFPDAPMTVEIKARPAAERAAHMLAGRPGPLIVTAFSPLIVAAVRRAEPSLDTAPGWPTLLSFWLASRLGRSFPLPSGHVALQPPLGLWGVAIAKRIPLLRRVHVTDQRLVAEAHKRALVVHVWTLNDEADMTQALEAGADGIFSDRPSLLTNVLDAAGLRWQSDQ